MHLATKRYSNGRLVFREATVTDASGSLADASNVLVLASRLNDAGADACADLLANSERALDRIVVVAVGQSPRAWQNRLDRHPALSAAAVSYVDVKTLVRSSAAAESEPEPITPAATVSSPADLGSLGAALNDLLAEAAAAGEQVGLCLHSITDMLQFVDREFLFKFLHTLGERVRQVGGIAYYHLDNGSPDDKLETLFAHLSDAVVSIDGTGMSVSSGHYAEVSGDAGPPASPE